MSGDKQATTGELWPRELTPDEAAKLRAHHLALAREAAENQDPSDSDSTDATVAAFVLPGD
jgi:hypothetical protein